MEELREELAALRRLVEMLAAREGVAIPRREIYPKDEAAELLGGFSVKTLDRMIAKGEINCCPLGLKPKGGIPHSEIQRFAAQRTGAVAKATGAKRGPKPQAQKDAKTEAAEFRASLRQR